jgi:hypothetical protein
LPRPATMGSSEDIEDRQRQHGLGDEADREGRRAEVRPQAFATIQSETTTLERSV